MMQEVAELRLTKQEEKDLRDYAEALQKFINPEIKQYSPIGWRKRPKAKCFETQKVYQERESLQKKLDIGWNRGWGKWKLEMVGAREMPGGWYHDESYSRILPIYSERKEVLEYLAEQMEEVFRADIGKLAEEGARKLPEGGNFFVRGTMVSCEGDCSWDCK